MKEKRLITSILFSVNNLVLLLIILLFVVFALVYFFKTEKNKNIQWKLVYLVILMFFFIGIYLSIKKDQDFNTLKKDSELSIGLINKYIVTKAGKGQNGNRCGFNFQADGRLISAQNNSNPYTNLPNNKPSLKVNYLVIYQKNHPKNNFILLNYPIKDSIDFLNYRKEFQNKIPENAFKK